MTRILTAVVFAAFVIYIIFRGSWWGLLLVIAAIATITYFEYARMLRVPQPILLVGGLAGLVLLTLAPDRILTKFILFALVALLLPLGSRDLHSAFSQVAVMFVGVIYIFGAFKTGYLLGVRDPKWLLFALAINWIGDSGAYYAGRRWGKTKLAPRISPGKSWEGAIASLALSTVLSALIIPHFLPISAAVAALLALAGNTAGQVGDLSESALKRGASVKDSGTLLPGHGGMLDRVDSALFTLPVIYSLVTGFGL